MPTIRVFDPDGASHEERKIGRTRLSAVVNRLAEDGRTVVKSVREGNVVTIEYTVNPPKPHGAASVKPGRNHNVGGRRISAEKAVASFRPWSGA